MNATTATNPRPTATKTHPARVRPRDPAYRSRSQSRTSRAHKHATNHSKCDQAAQSRLPGPLSASSSARRCAGMPRARLRLICRDQSVTMRSPDLRRWALDRILNPLVGGVQ